MGMDVRFGLVAVNYGGLYWCVVIACGFSLVGLDLSCFWLVCIWCISEVD